MAEPMRLWEVLLLLNLLVGKATCGNERQRLRLRLHQSPQFRELGGIHAAPRETYLPR